MLAIKIIATVFILIFIDWVVAVGKYEKEKDEERREIYWARCEKSADRMIKGGIGVLILTLIGIWFA